MPSFTKTIPQSWHEGQQTWRMDVYICMHASLSRQALHHDRQIMINHWRCRTSVDSSDGNWDRRKHSPAQWLRQQKSHGSRRSNRHILEQCFGQKLFPNRQSCGARQVHPRCTGLETPGRGCMTLRLSLSWWHRLPRGTHGRWCKPSVSRLSGSNVRLFRIYTFAKANCVCVDMVGLTRPNRFIPWNLALNMWAKDGWSRWCAVSTKQDMLQVQRWRACTRASIMWNQYYIIIKFV